MLHIRKIVVRTTQTVLKKNCLHMKIFCCSYRLVFKKNRIIQLNYLYGNSCCYNNEKWVIWQLKIQDIFNLSRNWYIYLLFPQHIWLCPNLKLTFQPSVIKHQVKLLHYQTNFHGIYFFSLMLHFRKNCCKDNTNHFEKKLSLNENILLFIQACF